MHSDSQQFVRAAGWFETLTEVTRPFLAQGGLVWQRAASVPGMKESGPIPHGSAHWPLVVMLPAFCPQIAPIMPALPTPSTRK
ncbi:MAG: hypothetical protein QOJ42_2752 [Acidobacteriaceae bacterium]|jgi:hypothetical protein|nr:hypothetical protein [Acidobacteriaceae bacterium]MDT7812836.1 hypothetical protein [Acidobacteriaceae bacterium]MDX6464934.1 hypothetical protein [Acidobacteriaceae bacterium]